MFNKLNKKILVLFVAVIFVFPVFTYAAEYTGFGVQFDVQPRLIQNSVSTQLRFTFKGNVVNQFSLNEYCSGGNLRADVISPLANGQNAGFRNNVQASGISNPVGTGSLSPAQQINWDFNENYTHNTGVNYRVFQGVVTCGGKEVASSSTIQVNVSSQTGGTGTGGTGTGGTPGGTQTYPFEISNPLKGGADDFSELVKILAQWIFNLAIPIAVAMIVYSGILFLTAAGELAKVTKARDVLKYAVIGLAIIMIGSGFVTLIQSILELGSPPEQIQGQPVPPITGGSQQFPIGTTVYGCTSAGFCVSSDNPSIYSGYSELSNDATCNNACSPTGPTGDIGSLCFRDRGCQQPYECVSSICQRDSENFINEPCNSGRNCRGDTICDKSRVIVSDGRRLGTCTEKP